MMKTPNLSRRALLGLGIAAATCPGLALAQTAQPDVEGGIGGTGIVGLLTDFGSLIVAGNYLRTDAQTRYSDGFGPLRKSDLGIGESLTVEAAGPANALVARRVHVTHPVVGTVTAVTAGGRRITVNGVSVRLESRQAAAALGRRVAVSGLWRGAEIQAAKLAPARSTQDLVSGDVSRRGGVTRVGGVAVRGPGTGSIAPGSFASVVGAFDPQTGVLRATRVENARFTGAAGALVRLSIEGYLTPTARAPGFRVAGLGHSFEHNLNLSAFAQTRVVLNGAYTGLFAAESGIALPETFAGQRRVLRQVSNRSR